MLVLLAGSLALCAAATARTAAAADNSSPYQGIVERNVFGLKPPPPPPSPEDNKPPPPKILLTGITTILGNKRALMKMTPPVTKPGEQPKEQGFTLAEGERDGGLEVLEIDEKEGTVKVNNYGTVATLNFKDDGVKTAPGAPPGAPPGVPPGMRPGLPMPGAPGGVTPMPNRPLRVPGAGAPVTPQAATGSAVPSVNGGVNPLVAAQPAAAAGSSPEEYAILLEFNRIRTQPLVDAGELPPLPPDPLSADARAAILGPEPDPTAAATPAPAPAAPRFAPTIPLPLPQYSQ